MQESSRFLTKMSSSQRLLTLNGRDVESLLADRVASPLGVELTFWEQQWQNGRKEKYVTTMYSVIQ